MHILDTLGITKEVTAKGKAVAGIHNAELVAKGEADIAIQLSHEILAVPGIQFVPLPPESRSSVVFFAGVSATTKHEAAANALVRFLTLPLL